MRSASSSTEMPFSSSIQSCVLVAMCVSPPWWDSSRRPRTRPPPRRPPGCRPLAPARPPPAQLSSPPRARRGGGLLGGVRLGSAGASASAGLLCRGVGLRASLGLRGRLASAAARPRRAPRPPRPASLLGSGAASAAGASPAGISPDSFFSLHLAERDGDAAEQRVQRAHEAADGRGDDPDELAVEHFARGQPRERADLLDVELVAVHQAALERQQLGRARRSRRPPWRRVATSPRTNVSAVGPGEVAP